MYRLKTNTGFIRLFDSKGEAVARGTEFIKAGKIESYTVECSPLGNVVAKMDRATFFERTNRA